MIRNLILNLLLTCFIFFGASLASSAENKAIEHDEELESLYRTFLVGFIDREAIGRSKIIFNQLRFIINERRYISTDEVVKRLYIPTFDGPCSLNFKSIETMDTMRGENTFLNYSFSRMHMGQKCAGFAYFASTKPVNKLSPKIFRPIKLTSDEVKLFNQGNSNVRAFIKGDQKIVIIDGKKILSLSKENKINEIWSNNITKLYLKKGYFIADLDNDGNIEVLLDYAGHVTINELSGSGVDMLLQIPALVDESEVDGAIDYSYKLLMKHKAAPD